MNKVYLERAKRFMRREQFYVTVEHKNGNDLMRTTETYYNKKEAKQAFLSVRNDPYEFIDNT